MSDNSPENKMMSACGGNMSLLISHNNVWTPGDDD
jgi:hypothetical protein